MRTKSNSGRENASERSGKEQGRASGGEDRRQAGPTASLHRTVGNQAVKRAREDGKLRDGIAVSSPDDDHEREARRVAARVVNASDSGAAVDPGATAVDRGAAGDSTGRSRAIRRRVERATRGGTALGARERSFFESRFGTDLSDVRIHTGTWADRVARSLDARAFTVGTDVVFRAGEYDPETDSGKRLLAHELTHVLQRDAVAADRPAPVVHRQTDPPAGGSGAEGGSDDRSGASLDRIRELLETGTKPMEDWDSKKREAVILMKRLPPEKKKRVLSDDDFRDLLGSSVNWPGLAVAADYLDATLQQKLDLLVVKPEDYTALKVAIHEAPEDAKEAVLNDATFLKDRLKDALSWNDFAKVVELLGREPPTADDLKDNATVTGALDAAWNASNPGNPSQGANPQEQGGWIYLNIVTDAVQTNGAPGGNQSSISLSNPPTVTDSVVVANYHTHPNLGPNWQASPSQTDRQLMSRLGVPGLVRAVNDQIFACGPDKRAHLAGPRGYPGSSGTIAPQAKLDDDGNVVKDDV